MIQHTLHIGNNVIPEALILVLLLRPHKIGIGVAKYLVAHQIEWEGTKLLDARQGHSGLQSSRGTLLLQIIVGATGAENVPLDRARIGGLDGNRFIGDKTTEFRARNEIIET